MSTRSGEAATVVFTLDVEPDAAVYWVENEDGERILAQANVSGGAIDGAVVTLTVSSELNTLATGQHRGLRVVRLRYRAEDAFPGWRDVEYDYDVVGAEDELVVQTNSFVTYNEALLLSREMTGAEGFTAATRAARVAALAEAWRTLVRLTYDIPDDYDRVMTRVTDFPGADPGDLADMNAAAFLSLDSRFVAAIKRAQVAEALERLNPARQALAERRDMGLMSSTIGEVSQMYRAGRSLELGVSKRALMELRGYVVFSPRMGRA